MGNYVRHAQDDKERIIDAAIPQLAAGTPTDVIAAQYGISPRTLRHWLIHDDAAEEARSAFLTGQMMDAIGEMEVANDQLPLARARERFKSYAWIAERRLPDKFGVKKEVRVSHSVDMSEALNDARKALQARKVSTTYSVESIEDAQIVGESDPNQA